MEWAVGTGKVIGEMGMPTENRNTDWGLTASQPKETAGTGVIERRNVEDVMPARSSVRDFQAGAKLRGDYTMRCNHCREWNSEEEHRCRRCGRRLMSAGSFNGGSEYDRYPVNLCAVAPSYERSGEVAQRRESTPENYTTTANRHRAAQGSLFTRGETQKVVSIFSDSPAPVVRRETSKRSQTARPANPINSQQQLIFTPPEFERRRSADTSIEAVIFCSDPVASIVHRMLASVADIAFICIAIGLFAITFSLAGGEIIINSQTILVYASIPIVIAGFYKYLWVIAGADSPGMKWAGLRTVNFDGKKPGIMQRFLRMGGGCVGLAAAAVGLFWALVDEETLTWHDHISHTFSTPA